MYFRLYADSIRGLPRETWVLALVALVNRAGTMVVPFLALYLTKSLGFGKAEAGELIAIWGVGVFAGSFVGGWLSDRFHPVRVQAVMMAACGGGFYWLGECRSFTALAVALFVTGGVFAAFRPANATMLAATCPPLLRARAFAVQRLAINLGMAIGPSTGGLIASDLGYSWLFTIDGSVCILSGVLVWILLRGVRLDTVGQEDPVTATQHSPWRDRLFLGVALLVFLNGYVMFQWFSTGPVFFADVYAMSEKEIGLLFALNPVLIVAFEMVLIYSIRDRPPMPWIALGTLLLTVSCGMITLGSGVLWCLVTVCVWDVRRDARITSGPWFRGKPRGAEAPGPLHGGAEYVVRCGDGPVPRAQPENLRLVRARRDVVECRGHRWLGDGTRVWAHETCG